MATESQIKSNKQQSSVVAPAPKSHTSVRVFGVIILIIQFGLLFVYGFEGYLLNELTSWGANYNIAILTTYFGSVFYWITLIFTIIGFGCLYAANSRTTLTGFFISFFVVGFTTIFSPVMQKFWFNVFSFIFSPSATFDTATTNAQSDYMHYLSGSDVWISFYVMRISLLNAVSQLVVFYGLYQRFNIAQIFFFSLFYQVLWTLNFHLNVEVSRYQPDQNHRFFDDYAINQVFLFASVFSIVVCFLTKKPPKEDLRFGRKDQRQVGVIDIRAQNELPLIISLIGTFLLYISFMGITILYPTKSAFQRYFSPQTFMNILFALSACVFTNMFLSVIIKGKLGIRQIHFGMIGGAIMSGAIAGTLDNIGAMMAIGTFAGTVSALFFSFVYPKMNRNSVIDTYGVFYIFIVSLLGTMMVAPLVLRGMYNGGVLSNQLNNVVVSSWNSAGWSLVYVGISFGIALVGGFILGLFLRCLGRQILKEFDDENIFITLPGLNDQAYFERKSRIAAEGGQTEAHLYAENEV